jgi:hypothetical protein
LIRVRRFAGAQSGGVAGRSSTRRNGAGSEPAASTAAKS